MYRLGFLAGVVGLSALAAAPARAGLVSFPYSNDFSTSVSDFVENADAHWSLNTGTGVYNDTIAGSGTSSSTMVQATALGGPAATATSFRMQTTFRATNFGGDAANTVGFAALGFDDNSTDAAGTFYLADVKRDGRLRLYEINGTGMLSDSINFAGGALATGVDYTLTLDATYVGSSVKLDLTLTNGTQTTAITFTDATALTGQYFGMRNRANSSGGVNVNYDSFAITAVPEPASLLALPAAAVLLGIRRRRHAVAL